MLSQYLKPPCDGEIQSWVDLIIHMMEKLREKLREELRDNETKKTTASEEFSVSDSFITRFHELRWEVAEQIGFIKCGIAYDEGDNTMVIYDILNDEDEKEFIKIKIGEECKATMTFYTSSELIEEMN